MNLKGEKIDQFSKEYRLKLILCSTSISQYFINTHAFKD